MSDRPSSPVNRPLKLFTKKLLSDFEAELEKNGENILHQNVQGSTRQFPNPDRHVKINPRVSPGEKGETKWIRFQDMRVYEDMLEEDRREYFFPLKRDVFKLHGPALTHEELVRLFDQVQEELGARKPDFEASLVVRLTELFRDRNVTKVFGFGLGAFGAPLKWISDPRRREEDRRNYVREHLALSMIGMAAKAADPPGGVRVFVQDPGYTSECKRLLKEELGFEIIDGCGAKGFTLVDDQSVAIVHHPAFLFRPIIADTVRPVLIGMHPQRTKAECLAMKESNPEQYYELADMDSDNSRLMLQDYTESPDIQARFLEARIFGDNAWYVRKREYTRVDEKNPYL
ncbi:hypothetical protein GGR56DRAFT_643356 [Xylariaceae sp. FL0804]|nr:hypothetical protein GGR56DRAFT_643356 [Xylariaceae sp. FL0804]